MNSYPVILIPDVLQNVQLELISKPTKPIYPKKPKPPSRLPAEPQPINVQSLVVKGIIGLGITLFFGLFLSLFNSTLGVFIISLGLVILLVFMMLNNLTHLKTFSQRKQAHESLQQRYLLKLDNYSIALSEFDRRKENYDRDLREYAEALEIWEQQSEENNSQLQSILTDLITYQGKNSKAKRRYSEHKFETYLRQYFGSKIKVGLFLKNTN
ncbi:MAG: hypothetical protein MK111_18305 [Crocosphaera sp.]|uniref:hypothetical protein n=1 Tax=Crocosphaera sp. TaxID=2729996 RepID=UPI00258DF084|nr:hypothetical protein [Crocosphaera sp.]MCH2246553.1 hypothetical protein [Crocosphaera sp.]